MANSSNSKPPRAQQSFELILKCFELTPSSRPDSKKTHLFSKLPIELFVKILDFIDLDTAFIVFSVCKLFRSIFSGEWLLSRLASANNCNQALSKFFAWIKDCHNELYFRREARIFHPMKHAIPKGLSIHIFRPLLKYNFYRVVFPP